MVSAIVIREVIKPIAAARNRAPIGALEAELAVRLALHQEAALVQQPMVIGAEQREVVGDRLTAVFTRLLQSDPALDGVAAVLFDEYHERSLHADVGLAFVLDAQRHLAPELRVLAMSATIDGARVAELLGDAPVIESLGKIFDVEVRYAGKGVPVLPGGPEYVDAIAAPAGRRKVVLATNIAETSLTIDGVRTAR